MAQSEQQHFKDKESFDDHFETVHAVYTEALRATDVWGIEVIKTLFLLNAAGLTGVFAMVAATDIHRSSLPFLQFAVGIVFAVLSMTFGRYMHALASSGWQDALKTINTENRPVYELPTSKIVTALEFLSHVTAYCSAATCIWAGWLLYDLF